MTARLTAQNSVTHYLKKLDEEKKLLVKAEELAAGVTGEFEVGVYHVSHIIASQPARRSGPQRRSNIARESTSLVNQISFSAI